MSNNSGGFSFFIPELNIKFSDILLHYSCSFTTQCYTIMMALIHIQSLDLKKILKVWPSQSVLCVIALYVDDWSYLSSRNPYKIVFVLFIITVELLWVPGHAGVLGNEMADLLTISTKSFVRPPIQKIPSSDLLSLRSFKQPILRDNYK